MRVDDDAAALSGGDGAIPGAPMTAHRRTPEPVTPAPPRPIRLVTMRQDWLDVVFLHWEIDPAEARRFLPDGVEPDLIDGRTYVGLIGLRIRVWLLGVVPLPYVGVFPEVNVRLYGVDAEGRRGIVFCSLDAGRLAPTVVARAGYRLPYFWWAGSAARTADVVTYEGRRRWPDGGAPTRFAVRVGAPVAQPTALDHFLTARWALQWSALGRTLWCPAAHQPWPLHHAEVVECTDGLMVADGLSPQLGPPVSALYAPAVSARISAPRPI